MPWQPNKLEQERLDKLERLKARGIDPFPPRVNRTHTIAAAITAFKEAEAAKNESPISATVCGRLRAFRGSGKVSFGNIEDGTENIQLFVQIDRIGAESYEMFKKELDLGDFLQVEGVMMRTKTGEISVGVNKLTVLAKALSPLPVIKEQEVDGKTVAHGSFSDVEERYRQRYVDLASNPK